jgi:ribosomal protein S18 acetylase RimI-like enzyme
LQQDDLPLYRPLRLQALRQHPEAFGSSAEEEEAAGNDMARMIANPPGMTLGGFIDGALVGTAGLFVSPKRKHRHKGHIVGVYVAPPFRRTRLARAMLDRLIHEARATGLIMLTLSVTVGNEAARRLYRNAGFVPYGIEPGSLMIGSALLDEELLALPLDGAGTTRRGRLPDAAPFPGHTSAGGAL